MRVSFQLTAPVKGHTHAWLETVNYNLDYAVVHLGNSAGPASNERMVVSAAGTDIPAGVAQTIEDGIATKIQTKVEEEAVTPESDTGTGTGTEENTTSTSN